jgi:phosphatidylethanolamine-binding protein (PEBP) family uncharacterized protein
MGRSLKMAVGGALTVTLAFAGCGGSGSSKSQSSATSAGESQTTSTAASTATTQTSGATTGAEQTQTTSGPKEHIPKNAFAMSSPVFEAGSLIPARYTCDGGDVSPPLRWSAIPPGTVELALFILNLNSRPGGKFTFYWAVAGLHPTLKGIPAGRLPDGAIVGRNSLGQSRYTICPTKGEGLQHYVVALFAAQHPAAAQPGFSADALYKMLSNTAEYKGLTGFTYQRH